MTDGEQPVPTTEEPVRLRIAGDDLTYEAIKTAIYAQARYQFEHGRPMRTLLISRDIYEIMGRRLVFKTAAHKDFPHFITPFGNLRVEQMPEEQNEAQTFIIS